MQLQRTRQESELNEKAAELIGSLYSEVVKTVSEILKAHNTWNFQFINENLDPSIDDILIGLKFIESALNTLHSLESLLGPEEVNTVLNGKQCILLIQRLATAVKNEDEAQYQEAIRLLDKQYK